MPTNDLDKFWNKQAKALEGRTIKTARYMTQDEADNLGWFYRVVVIELDDGTLLYPSMDDEGNNGGALFAQNPDGTEGNGFPVLR